AGRRLIPMGPMAAVLARTAELKYRPLIKLRPDLPKELDRVLRQALSISAEGRFESVSAFGRALEVAFAELKADGDAAVSFAQIYRPQRTEEDLDRLRELARSA